MKKLLIGLPLFMVLSVPTLAQTDVDVEVDDVTMDVAKHAREHRNNGIKNIVAEYMLEQGDITQEELDALKARRAAVREELKALKESGDEEALAARIAELREERAATREEIKAYIASHEDLAAIIQERREEVRDRRDQRREERRARRGERGEN